MARSLVSSITRPISSLIAPVLKPALRFAKHPLAPLGMGVAGMVVENVAEKVGLTGFLTTAGVQGVEFLKGGAKTGFAVISGIADFDGEDDKPKTKTEAAHDDHDHANVAGTPNALDDGALHVGCAADKACGPCAKKQLLAKVGAALEKMSPAELKDFEVGLSRPKILASRPSIPRTHADVATQATATASNAQAQIAALQTQLAQAQDAVAQQRLTDQIAAMQAQLAQATALAQGAQAGGSLATLLEQLTQLKAIENLLSPAATPPTAVQPVDAFGYPTTPPWGSYQDQDGGILQDPNGTTYGNPDIDPQFVSNPLIPEYGSQTGDQSFDQWADYSVEGASSDDEVDGTAYPILDDNGECLPCKSF